MNKTSEERKKERKKDTGGRNAVGKGIGDLKSEIASRNDIRISRRERTRDTERRSEGIVSGEITIGSGESERGTLEVSGGNGFAGVGVGEVQPDRREGHVAHGAGESEGGLVPFF